MSKILFIGGPKDGEFLNVTNSKYYEFPMADKNSDGFGKIRYTVNHLQDSDGQVLKVACYDHYSTGIIRKLIEGYKNKGEKDGLPND